MRNRLRKPIAITIPAVAALVALLAVATVIQGGDLEPPGPPTVGTTHIAPSWSQILAANDTGDDCNSSRFRCVMPTAANPTGEAVLDNETGLVWQRRLLPVERDWASQASLCLSAQTGDRWGWHLPTAEEHSTLLGPVGDPALPNGHPFTNVPVDATGTFVEGGEVRYWTATSDHVMPTDAVSLKFVSATQASLSINSKNDRLRLWCVRGGQGIDGGH